MSRISGLSNKNNNNKRFLLLGDSGSGKSTFINYLANYFEGEKDFQKIIKNSESLKIAIPCKNWNKNVLKRFSDHSNEKNIEDVTTSQTGECYEYEFNTMSFIDTPGLNDTRGSENDIQNLKKIVDAVTIKENLHGIILLINGTMPRLSTSMLNFISLLKSFLPASMIRNNLIVVLTNCDEESCNFDLDCLKDIFTSGNSYTMQNSFLRWNKDEHGVRNERLRETMKNSWSHSLKTIDIILKQLNLMSNSPTATELFKITSTTAKTISKNISKQIEYLIDLVDKINALELQRDALVSSQKIMNDNLVHEKQFTIDAIPFIQQKKKPKKKKKNFMKDSQNLQENNKKNLKRQINSVSNVNGKTEKKKKHENSDDTPDENLAESLQNLYLEANVVNNKESKNSGKQQVEATAKSDSKLKTVKIQVSLPDNESKCQHKHAQQEIDKSEKKIEKMKKKIVDLETELESNLISVERDILDLRVLCVDFNFAFHLNDELKKFEEKVESFPKTAHLKNYFDRLMNLINNN